MHTLRLLPISAMTQSGKPKLVEAIDLANLYLPYLLIGTSNKAAYTPTNVLPHIYNYIIIIIDIMLFRYYIKIHEITNPNCTIRKVL